jgi:hypothetical protein
VTTNHMEETLSENDSRPLPTTPPGNFFGGLGDAGALRPRVALTAAAKGVGSRFRVTTNHMEKTLSENDSRPLPPMPPGNFFGGLGDTGALRPRVALRLAAKGVGSRFRVTTNHMEEPLSENDSRPLPTMPPGNFFGGLGDTGALRPRVALTSAANGVGSRFRVTTNHMEKTLSENDSRPLPTSRVFPDHLVLNRRSRIRFQQRLRQLELAYLAGEIDELTLQQRGTSLVAFTQAAGAKSWHFRRAVIEQMPVSGRRPATG